MRGTNQVCVKCGEFKVLENYDTMLCPSCNRSTRKVGDEDLYPEVRKMFLQMCERVKAICPITESPITIYSDIHHKKGRIGYASEEKKKQGVSLLIDPDFFLAVSRKGHQYIETHPKEAREHGWTLTRMDVIVK